MLCITCIPDPCFPYDSFCLLSRDYHAEAVFTSMVTIMTLVLEESEDIPVEMLSPILACVKKDNVVRYHESLSIVYFFFISLV